MMDSHLNTVPTLSKTEEEHNTEMLKPTNMESLPDDAIFNILVRVPAQDIYQSARFVCPRWFLLSRAHDFVRAHLLRSTHGLLIQDIRGLITAPGLVMNSKTYERPILVGTRNGRIEISNFENHKFIGRVMSSCNGLILEIFECLYNHLYITNPATKQQIALPTNKTVQSSAIAYAAATKEYKVVHAFYDDIHSNSTPDGIAILTVGVDIDWRRRVDIQHLSLKDRWLLRQAPLATQGFVHWAEEEYVLTLNVENEVITQSRVPTCLRIEGEKLRCCYLSMGSRLSVFIGRTMLSWEVWEMESGTGEWRKVMIVDLEGQKGELEAEMGCEFKGQQMKPVGWSKFGEVLVFSNVSDRVRLHDHKVFAFAYNVGTRGIESFELDSGSRNFVVHRNSLVWLN